MAPLLFTAPVTLPRHRPLARVCHVRAPRACATADAASRAADAKTSEQIGVGAPALHPLHALPSVYVHKAPHLTDYLPDLVDAASPLLEKRAQKTFTARGDTVLQDIAFNVNDPARLSTPLRAYEKAGPRERVFFPSGVRAAIVSCGGICPGINSVIRELTLCLFQYHAAKVFGVRHGYRGFHAEPWMEITPEDVEVLHKTGGSMLGTSRGGFDLVKIVDAIETRRVDQVYVIGGDGTIMGCTKIYHEIVRRGLKTSVVSVPKTIDNDIMIIDRSFGKYFVLFFLIARRFVYGVY